MQAVLLVVTCTHLPSIATAQLTFGPRTDYATGSSPRSVALGDLNHDGLPDLVVANYSSNTMSVRLNLGGGTFGARADLASGNNPISVALADLNGDGNLDAAVADRAIGAVSVLLGNGAGSFSPRIAYGTGTLPASVAIGDLNADSHPDLVVANGSGLGIAILLNNGDGTFQPRLQFAVGSNPMGVAIGSLNADGTPDVVAACYSGFVSLLPGNGDGTFSARSDLTVPGNPIAVAVEDVDGDGKQDLFVARYGLERVSIFPGLGNGTFGARTDYATGKFPAGLAVHDFTGDGWPDLAVANSGPSTLSLFYNDASGTLVPAAALATGATPLAVAAADVNGDGLPDLAVANSGASSVSIFFQTLSPPILEVTPATLDFGEGFVAYPETLGIRIRNVGSQPLDVTDLAISSAEFTVLGSAGFTLGRGEHRDLGVRYARSVPESFTATLTVTSTAPANPTAIVALSGSAIDPPVAEVSPAAIELSARVGLSDEGVLTISNSGLSDLTFVLATVDPRPAWLTFSPTSEALGPGTSVAISVDASAAGLLDGTYSATLRLSSNDPVRPQIDVPVSFHAIGMARIALSPPALDFGTAYIGDADSLPFTVSNVGTDTLIVSGMTIDSDQFAAGGGLVFSLPPGQNHVGRVEYPRTVDVSVTATLSVASNDSAAPVTTIAISGAAVDPPHLVIAPLVLPRVFLAVGDSTVQTLTVSNPSRGSRLDVQLQIAPVAGLSATPPFGVAPLSASIGPGESLPFPVVYRGLDLPGRDLQSTLTMSSNDPAIPVGLRALALHIRGVPAVGLSSDSLDFGPGYIGYPNTLTLAVSNIGTDTLHVSDISFGDSAFALQDPATFTLTQSASRVIHVQYRRPVAEVANTVLSVISDDPASPGEVRLLGVALDPPVVRVTPDALVSSVQIGDSTEVALSIENGGLGPLAFNIGLRLPPGPEPPHPPSIAPAAAHALAEDMVFSTGDPVVQPGDRIELGAGIDPLVVSGILAVPGTRVLVIGDGGTETDVVSVLASAGYVVTLVADDSGWNGSNPAPTSFAAVVLLDGIDFGDDMPAAGQQALLDYVGEGGGLVLSEWISYEISQGRYSMMSPLVPITRTTGVTGLLTYTVVQSHVVTNGVSASFQATAGVTRGTVNSGTAVVNLPGGTPAVVVKDREIGRLVEFALAGNYNNRRPFLSLDVQRLLLNAVMWVSGHPWLHPFDRSGVVAPGEEREIVFRLDATWLPPGDRTAEIVFSSNDPVRPEVSVPLRLTVYDQPTPAMVSLVSQEADDEHVRLVWHSADGAAFAGTIQRRRGDEPWRAVRDARADGSGLVVFEDRDVAPGERYGYRIALHDAAGESFAGEVWVQVPAAVLALDPVRPNPTAGDLLISFSLPDRQPGRLELFDVSGRRVRARDVERAGPARQTANLGEGAALPPGLYIVRLSHGGRALTARALVLR